MSEVSERYLRIKEVSSMLSMSRSNIYRLVSLGQFPAWIKLSDRVSVWKLSDIHQWVKEKQ